MQEAARWRIGFDIGGTFTDFVLYDGREGAVIAAQAPDHARTIPRKPR